MMEPVLVRSSMKLLLAALCVTAMIHIAEPNYTTIYTSTIASSTNSTTSYFNSTTSSSSTSNTSSSIMPSSESTPLTTSESMGSLTTTTGGSVCIGVPYDVLFLQLVIILAMMMGTN